MLSAAARSSSIRSPPSPSSMETSTRSPATFSTRISRSWARWPSLRTGWTSLVSASTRNAWSSWPSRLNRVLASEQSPQKTPSRCRSTSRPAMASSSRSRCLTSSRGRRRNSRRNCQECSRYSVTRIELPVSGWSTRPTGRTAGSSRTSRSRRTRYSLTAIRLGQLLEGVQDVVGLHEADQVAAGPDVEVAEAGRVLGPLLQRVQPRQGEQPRGGGPQADRDRGGHGGHGSHWAVRVRLTFRYERMSWRVGRSHSEARVGWTVWSTRASSSARSASGSTCWRSRTANASMVAAAS